MSAQNKLKYIIICLNKIRAYYGLIHLCRSNINLNITSDNVFSEEIYRILNAQYKIACTEKLAFIRDELAPEQPPNCLDDPHRANESTGYIQLLFRNHQIREVYNKVRPALNQSASNVYNLLNSICSIASTLTLSQSHEAFLDRVHNIVNGFEGLLKDLSDDIENLSVAVRSSAFSLGRFLEKLEQNYEVKYESAYRPQGMFSWFTFYYSIKKSFRNPNRIQEITFIMRLSLHPKSTEELRRSAIEIVNRKIIEKESPTSANNSLLKKLLDAGIMRSVAVQNANYFVMVSNFCRDHSLEIPEHLQSYIRDKMISSRLFY